MARIKAFGAEFTADLIENLGNGLWKAVARSHTGRTAPGTTITVKQSEILEASADEMPADPTGQIPASPSAPASPSSSATSTGLAELETAMAKERETLPSPADLIAQHRENLKVSPEKAVSVPPGPTSRP